MRFKNSFVLFFIFLLFFASCTIQKRNYTKGYFVQWKKSCTSAKEKNQLVFSDCTKKKEFIFLPTETGKNKNVLLTVSADVFQIKNPKPVFTGTKTYLDNCDTIVFRDSTKIRAKVLEISQDKIKYRKCSNLDGPIFSVSKSKIAYIKYVNGQQEEFTIEKTENGPTYLQQEELLQELIGKKATTALVLSILSFFLLYFGIVTAFFAIIKARNTLKLIKKNPPTNPKLVRRAKTALIIAYIAFSLILILSIITIIVSSFL